MADNCCASCGIAELDDIKLTECDGCDLVRYCSDACKADHRSEHEAKCKERVAELRDELLFKQPESSHYGDCPICCLPLTIEDGKRSIYPCCCKWICEGCSYAIDLRQKRENIQVQTCPFCRHPLPKTREEADKNMMKRIEANDIVAIREKGERRRDNGDYEGAFKYFTKVVELGDAMAHFELSVMYSEGHGVEKDENKERYHLEEAAIAGNPYAHYNLAMKEGKKGRTDRAVKHLIIAANLGDDDAIQMLKVCYRDGEVTKDDFAGALRAHHAAVEATKSPQRTAAANYYAAHRRMAGK